MWNLFALVQTILAELAGRSERAIWAVLLVLFVRLTAKRMCGKYFCVLWMITAAIFLIPSSARMKLTVSDTMMQELSVYADSVRIIPERSVGTVQNSEELWNIFGNFEALASVIWILGMGVILSVQLWRYIRTGKKLETAVKVAENIYRTDLIPSAFLFGIIRPRIYLPLMLQQEELEYAVRHERMHLRRRDSQIKFLVFLISTVYWWNPFAWIMYRGLENDMERACDEAVLQQEGVTAAGYAQSLLNAEKVRSRIGLCVSFVSGDTRRRIKNILSFRKAGHMQRICFLGTMILVTGPALLQIQAQEYSAGKVWQESVSVYSDFSEYIIFENRDVSPQKAEIFLTGTQILKEESAFHERIAESAQKVLEECEWLEELDVSWYVPENPQLWPYDGRRQKHVACFVREKDAD